MGTQDWKVIANYFPGRTADQCKNHWSVVLDPNVNREPWTAQEDAIIMEVCYLFIFQYIVVFVIQYIKMYFIG
jgi:hypothetical protein